MNQEHFLIELKLCLKDLPLEEQTAILDTYRDIFNDKIQEGHSEFEISQSLPSPKQIAVGILTEFDFSQKNEVKTRHGWIDISNQSWQVQKSSESSKKERLINILGVLALNLFFMIWVIFGVCITLMLTWFLVILATASPLLGGYLLFINGFSTVAIFQCSILLIVGGIGLIGAAVLIPLSRLGSKLLRAYLKWCFNTLK